MKTTLDPWDIIGWLLLGTTALALAAVILILLVMWQRHLLTQYLIRRDWRKTRHVAPPACSGTIQYWGRWHGKSECGELKIYRDAQSCLMAWSFLRKRWDSLDDAKWFYLRDLNRLTLLREALDES